MSRRLLISVLIVALGAGLLSSCGDDAEPLSKADFIKQMNALCKDREKAFAALDEGNFFNPKEGAKVWADLREPANTFVDGVLEIEPPDDVADTFSEYQDFAEKVPDLVDDIAAAAEDGELKPYNQHMAELFADQQGDIDMAEYGAEECYDEDEGLPQSQEPAEGATEVEVTAKEYEFEIPEGIKAGKLAFTLVNQGEEMHIFGFGQLKAGATFDQLKAEIDAGNEPELMTDEGLSGLAGPEGRSTVNADLTAGTYVAYCFIPSPDGTSHMSLGMLVPFEVE